MQAKGSNDLKPCWHMRTLVSAWADGKLSGLSRWYTEQHVNGCPQCQASLPFLRSLHFRLNSLGRRPSRAGLSDAQWQAVEAAWAEAEEQQDLPQRGGE